MITMTKEMDVLGNILYEFDIMNTRILSWIGASGTANIICEDERLVSYPPSKDVDGEWSPRVTRRAVLSMVAFH
jgi:hypothetical protein